MNDRKISRAAGILYLLTFVSIPTLAMYKSVKSTNYIFGSGSDTTAIVAGILEIIVGLAAISTAVVLFPMLKKQNEIAALVLVAARILEAATIFVGVAFILSIVSLRRDVVGAEYAAISHTLTLMYERIFLLGQSFMPAICDMLLGYLLLKSGLVPRRLAMLGIIAGPILLSGYLAVMFDLTAQRGGLAGLSAVPVALFEFSLGIWLVVKGFDRKAVARLK